MTLGGDRLIWTCSCREPVSATVGDFKGAGGGGGYLKQLLGGPPTLWLGYEAVPQEVVKRRREIGPGQRRWFPTRDSIARTHPVEVEVRGFGFGKFCSLQRRSQKSGMGRWGMDVSGKGEKAVCCNNWPHLKSNTAGSVPCRRHVECPRASNQAIGRSNRMGKLTNERDAKRPDVN